MKAPLLSSLPLLLLLPFAACTASSTHAGYAFERSYGSVVTGQLDTVWRATKETVARLAGRVEAREDERIVEASWSGADVAVKVEPKAEGETILRVSALRDGVEDTGVAERVQIAIQQELMRR